jgi:hypothetical protein
MLKYNGNLPSSDHTGLTLVLTEKKILNETKNHNPLLQVKWPVPYYEMQKRKPIF